MFVRVCLFVYLSVLFVAWPSSASRLGRVLTQIQQEIDNEQATQPPSATDPYDYASAYLSFLSSFDSDLPAVDAVGGYAAFKANAAFVEQTNNELRQQEQDFTLALNPYAIHSADSFRRVFASGILTSSSSSAGSHGLLRQSAGELTNTSSYFDRIAVAASVDWRARQAVTSVKNQGACGGCWAFSVSGAVEGAYAIVSGQLVDLSQQQMLDCSSTDTYGNQGCNGGLMAPTFDYLLASGGLCSLSSYNYSASQGACRACNRVATIQAYRTISAGDEEALRKAVNIGPVSVAIQADAQSLQFYSSGIYSDPACGRSLNHAVLLVGYGTETRALANGGTKNIDYWIVKNSWGAKWGEGGYIRMARGRNQCGIADMASLPTQD